MKEVTLILNGKEFETINRVDEDHNDLIELIEALERESDIIAHREEKEDSIVYTIDCDELELDVEEDDPEA